MLKIEIKTGNAAFYEEIDGKEEYLPQYELCRILDEIKRKIDAGYFEGNCIDYNGNTVGKWKLN